MNRARYSPTTAGSANQNIHFMSLFLFQGGAGGFGFLAPMLLIFGVFYLLLIRPQQKKQRDLQATIAQLKSGDKVITTGGVIGVITAVRDASFLIGS